MARTPKTPEPAEVEPDVPKKGRATPTRKEQEAARRRPLVPKDRRLANQQSRSAQAAERERVRVGMANGEERYLPLRDKGPQKRYVRDFVDARLSIGELLMPMLILVILTFFFDELAVIAMSVFWGIFFFVVADCILLGFQVRRRLAAKFGKDKVEKVTWYASMRAIQMRFLRIPKPQVKRGQYPS